MIKNAAKKIYIALIFPIVTLVVLSFNASKTRAKWGGFTLKWYVALFQNEDILAALSNTLLIALIASVVATIIGTAACLAIMSLKKKGRAIILGITNIPVSLSCCFLSVWGLNSDLALFFCLILPFAFLMSF